MRALATLEDYVLRETPTGASAAITAFTDALAIRYTELGGTVVLHPTPGGAHLVADFPGRGSGVGAAPVLLIGHSDTVWPVGTLAGDVPWTIDGTRITGPGVYDMKSGLVVMEEALELLRARAATGAVDHAPVRIIVTADEEIGSPTSGALLLATAEGCSAAIGFESPHPNGDLKVGRLGSTRLALAVSGVPAHAALDPEKGVSATEEIIDQLLRVRDIAARATTRAGARPGARVLYNLGSITAPGLANVVADNAVAVLGFRFSDPDIEGEVLDEIEALVPIRPRAEVAITRLSYRPAWKPRVADQKLSALISGCDSRLGDTRPGLSPLGAAPAAGAADTNLLGASALGVVDGFGPRGGGAHARSEHIIVASLWERIRLLAAVLTAIHLPG
ncbi:MULTISPECIES: M20/M25/M40 family metallo-hydrolase [unclassified Cryobacterium]|uniref:M20/M25/M40 family metallo-hydrolase n=1 Tax=unclassified Cryobacterium TaxID=2649013 RepID=UPI002AB3E26A|nr:MULTISPECIES: M20/M25/M40 family metallo-hydrolase [unclassified Cryobacterium]MDY7541285.1 M20/M25/M40 family metallo-hydrolase [Cryobacterium sp. 5B3]MEA9998085.1 M20/M25/M40 family metallo-hydrolase [Cryobacterium sp. RTS3]MEB0266545.1 M20/M25/M40 family metallo-hydrolase [Cryobacterium sp. 10I5]MEB0273416.1 M20/M25/M40 family metallo-hydrolase [Cryobacterium sp. 5B3]